MANMSYCRFQNTLKDLTDCWEHWEDAESEEELKAREQMKELIDEISMEAV